MTADPVFPQKRYQSGKFADIYFKDQGKSDHKRVSSPDCSKNIFIVLPEVDHGSFDAGFLKNGDKITHPQVFFLSEGDNKNRIICLVQSLLFRFLKNLNHTVNKFSFFTQAFFVIFQHQGSNLLLLCITQSCSFKQLQGMHDKWRGEGSERLSFAKVLHGVHFWV